MFGMLCYYTGHIRGGYFYALALSKRHFGLPQSDSAGNIGRIKKFTDNNQLSGNTHSPTLADYLPGVSLALRFLLVCLASSQLARLFPYAGLPIVTGYLTTGILVGPFGLALIPKVRTNFAKFSQSSDVVHTLVFLQYTQLCVVMNFTNSRVEFDRSASWTSCRLRSLRIRRAQHFVWTTFDDTAKALLSLPLQLRSSSTFQPCASPPPACLLMCVIVFFFFFFFFVTATDTYLGVPPFSHSRPTFLSQKRCLPIKCVSFLLQLILF